MKTTSPFFSIHLFCTGTFMHIASTTFLAFSGYGSWTPRPGWEFWGSSDQAFHFGGTNWRQVVSGILIDYVTLTLLLQCWSVYLATKKRQRRLKPVISLKVQIVESKATTRSTGRIPGRVTCRSWRRLFAPSIAAAS